MSAGRFKVLRPFLLDGVGVRAGAVVELNDGQLIADMLLAGKIVAYDAATEQRIRWNAGAKWSKGDPNARPERPEDRLWIRR